MFCTQCGGDLPDEAIACAGCGAGLAAPSPAGYAGQVTGPMLRFDPHPAGQLRLARQAERRHEQRGDHRRVRQPLALLKPGYLRLAVADRDTQVPLRQPPAPAQDAQQRAEVGKRRGRQLQATRDHGPTPP